MVADLLKKNFLYVDRYIFLQSIAVLLSGLGHFQFVYLIFAYAGSCILSSNNCKPVSNQEMELVNDYISFSS